VVEFGAGTCVACVKMKPIIIELQSEYKDRANVLLIDVGEHRELTPKYKIMLIPTQVFFDQGGKEIYRHVGFLPKDSLLVHLRQAGLE
jgi:thioredoxin 1